MQVTQYTDLFATLAVIAGGCVFLSWLVFQVGRLHGYRSGIEDGGKRALKTQHLKGMTDGYVMALQHTPAQRNEYMNNVLLRIGAVTQADIDIDSERRRQRAASMQA